MKSSKLSKLSLALFCAFILFSNRSLSADEVDKINSAELFSTNNSQTSSLQMTEEQPSTENNAEISEESLAEPSDNTEALMPSTEFDKVKEAISDGVEPATSEAEIEEGTQDSSQDSSIDESANTKEGTLVSEKVGEVKISDEVEVKETESSAIDEGKSDEDLDKSSNEDLSTNEKSEEELQEKIDPNAVEASTLGLSENNRRSRRAAGGWTVIGGAVYYIDPTTGLKVRDGVHFIDSTPYLFNEKGQLIKGFYTNSKGDRSFAKDDGVAYKLGAYTLSDGLRYVIDEKGVIAKDKWIDEPGYGRAYGRPGDGVAYRNGAFTVKDGIRYVFDYYGYLAIDQWVNEPGYGKAYGRPGDGAAYRGGAFTVKDGIRYVFNSGGYLAKGYWVDEPGYGRAYGRPSDGAAYRGGAFTVSNGVRYVFNSGGYLAKGYWVDEPGYGRTYGRPSDGAAYRGGAFTLNDGIRYVFNDGGYLAKGYWVYEKGYGKAYGDPKTGAAYRGGIYTIQDGLDYIFDNYGYAVEGKWVLFPNKGYTYAMPNTGVACKNGVHVVEGKKHLFNEKGYAVEGWYFVDDKGFCFGLGQKGELVVNKKIKMNNRIYHMDGNGFWSDRKQLSADELNNLDYQEKDNKLYLMVNGNKLDTPAYVNGKMIYVKPGTYELASSIGWHWFGDKEFYFTDKVSIAKPYQKVGNAYVNGAYGPRIYAEAKGIDVSSHNGDIDWKKVKSDDVDFAFIRASYTTNTDFKFDKNMNAAKQAGVKTGIYIYSMAKNKKDAEREADYIINLMKKYKIDLPVAFDIEDPEVLKETSSNRARTDIIHAFANKIQKAGYKVAVYSNLNWLNNYLVKDELVSKYDIWLAHWHSKPGLTSKYWQASETGKVEGINTNVDIDFAFSKLP